ncbi:MAG: MFS transporter [Planctomycetes bacterium]|nr:MFS transporter [Planctomycetota bacterium]
MTGNGPPAADSRRHLAWGALAFLLLLPVTLPVPVLRALVLERFSVSDGQATWFMAANMLGGLLVAPLIGRLGDRAVDRRRLTIAAILLDAMLLLTMAWPLSFAEFLALRVIEGMAHIAALTLLMALCADAAGERRGRAMGMVGGGLTLGVATGAALGGILGKHDPTATLQIGAAVLAAAALLAVVVLPSGNVDSRTGRGTAPPGTGRRMLLPLAFAFLDRFTVGFFTSGFPLFLAGVHRIERPQIGMLLGAFLFPFALLSYPFGKLAERRSATALVAIGSAVYGGLVALVGVVPPSWLWGLMPALGLASAVMFVPTLLFLLERAPGLGRSSAMAAFHGVGSAGFLLGPLCCGGIVTAVGDLPRGYACAFVAAGATELACVSALGWSLRRQSALHRTDDNRRSQS